jgi:hypothetical protein
MAGSERSLRDLIEENSTLSLSEGSEDKSVGIIARGLASLLAQGEEVLAYADRGLVRPGFQREIDIMALEPRPQSDDADTLDDEDKATRTESDAFAYDAHEGGAQQNVLEYEAKGRHEDTDAFAYVGAVPGPETDAFVSDAAGQSATDVDLLALTDRRLLRGSLRKGRLAWKEAPASTAGLVVTEGRSTVRSESGEMIEDVWFDISLPTELCEVDETGAWCWLLPEGLDIIDAASQWRSGR